MLEFRTDSFLNKLMYFIIEQAQEVCKNCWIPENPGQKFADLGRNPPRDLHEPRPWDARRKAGRQHGLRASPLVRTWLCTTHPSSDGKTSWRSASS